MIPSRATIPLIRPHRRDSDGGRIRGVLLYKDWIYWFTKTCAIFVLLTYNLMLTNSFINNLYDLPYRPTLLTSTCHTADARLWYDLQFLNQGIDKIMYILWIMRPLSNMSTKNVPCMFYWIEVWRPGWPVHRTVTFCHQGRSCGHVQYLALK